MAMAVGFEHSRHILNALMHDDTMGHWNSGGGFAASVQRGYFQSDLTSNLFSFVRPSPRCLLKRPS